MNSDLETRIQYTGLRLYGLIEAEVPSVFKKDYWIGKVLDWCMQDEAFKVEMFRFIDVFPYLTRPESVANHLQEYFCRTDQNFPSMFQWGIKYLSPASMAGKMIARSITNNLTSIGKHFIAGANPQEALPALEELRTNRMAFTVDLLGEAVVSEKEAEEYLRRYLELLSILDEAHRRWPPLGDGSEDLDWGVTPRVNISIKASAMFSQMEARAFEHSVAMAKERLRPIFKKAIEIGAFVYLDMEHSALKNLTLALYRSLMEESAFHDYPHTGIVIQAYLHESEQDLKDIIQWGRKRKQPFSIRLVKGAYWDAEIVWAREKNWPVKVFTRKQETDANFEKLARLILENHQWVRFGCASHNIRSISCVIELAKELGVPPSALEYQILYGMAEPVRNAMRSIGLPLRVYVPVGDIIPGMAYLVRRLLENTSNESFLRQSFVKGVSKKELLRNPSELLAESKISSKLGSEVVELDDKGEFQNEPLLDWTLAENRERFSRALDKSRKGFPLKAPLFINGRKVTTKKEISSTNPNNPQEVIGVVTVAEKAETEKSIKAAKMAFPAWRDTDPGVRAEYLFRAGAAARKMRYELAALQVYEVGKTWSEADADVCEAIDYLEYHGREMIRLAKPQRIGNIPGEISHLCYEPRGAGAVIAPWNFPLAISMGMIAAAVVTGNTVIYKPSSLSGVTGSMVYRIFEMCRLPSGVLNFLPGPGGEIGDLLVTHPDIAFIAFTGSKEVGLRIMELAGNRIEGSSGPKKVIAEMGGKNAIIVDADADLDEAVYYILHSAFDYQGQKCSACSRLIVLDENYDKLIDRLKAAAESIYLGPTEDPGSFMGAVIDGNARNKINHYIEIGKEEGTLLLERFPPANIGHCVPLAIFEGIRPEHRLAQEEIFGPVLAIMKVADFDEALEVANNTEYALTGAVISRSPANIDKARKRFRVGNLYINRGCTGAIVGRHPFGGFKMSGVGSKAGGPEYLQQFMVPRNVVENTLRRGFAPLE